MDINERIECDFCSCSNYKELYSAPDWINRIKGEYTIVKCRNCGFVYTNPRPKQEYINKFYPDDTSYYIPQMSNVELSQNLKVYGYLSRYLNYSFKEDIKVSMISDIKYRLYNRINIKRKGFPRFIKNGRLLDIGCSYGNFINQMRYLGWNVKGIDFNAKAAKFAREELGLDVENCLIENFKAETKFDVITLRMVLEHVYSPKEILLTTKRLLSDKGTLIFMVPSFRSIESLLFKGYAYGLHLPNHLYHFTPKTIKKYLYLCGYTNIDIYCHVTLNDITKPLEFMLEDGKKVKWILNILENRFVKSLLLRPFLEILAFFKMTGRMTIYAENRS